MNSQVSEIRKLVEQGAKFPVDVTEEVHNQTHTTHRLGYYLTSGKCLSISCLNTLIQGYVSVFLCAAQVAKIRERLEETTHWQQRVRTDRLIDMNQY